MDEARALPKQARYQLRYTRLWICFICGLSCGLGRFLTIGFAEMVPASASVSAGCGLRLFLSWMGGGCSQTARSLVPEDPAGLPLSAQSSRWAAVSLFILPKYPPKSRRTLSTASSTSQTSPEPWTGPGGMRRRLSHRILPADLYTGGGHGKHEPEDAHDPGIIPQIVRQAADHGAAQR